jgi:biotin carboxylase
MTKTLLVLAASKYQVPAIETAKALGYRVITTDNVATNPGHALADASYQVDTTDFDGVLRLAVREKISGVIAPGTDVAVITAARIAEVLGLPGPSPEAAVLLTRKLAFRALLQDAGLACPRVIRIADGLRLDGGLFGSAKWLLKPNCSSGSKGIFIVNDEAEYYSRVVDSRSFSLDGEAFLEEFLEGSQHTCEGVLEGGRVVLSLLTDRDTASAPYTATIGHGVPSRLPAHVQAEALSTIESVMARLGVSDGPFDCDFVATRDRVVLIEITPRLGGNSLSRLFKAALDFDLTAYAVTTACGDLYPVPPSTPPKAAAIRILGVEQGGRLTWNEREADLLSEQPWVASLMFDVPGGTQVSPFINGRNRVGEALITGENRDELDAHLLELTQRLALEAV